MSDGGRVTNRAGLTAGFLLISAAVAILVSWYTDVWWYFFPIMMIAGGAYLLAIAALASEHQGRAKSQNMIFILLWGGVLLIVGVEWIVNALYPGNFIFLFVALLVFIGVVAILGYLIRARK